MAGPLAGEFIADANGDKALGPVDDGTEEGLAWRAVLRDGNFAAGAVVLEADVGIPAGTVSHPLYVQESDGDNVTLGATADTAYTGSGSHGVVSILKGLYVQLAALVTGVLVSGLGIKVASTATPIIAGTADATGVEGLAALANRRLTGFSAIETGGTSPGTITLKLGISNAGADLAYVTVPAGQGMGDKGWGDDGIDAHLGVWIVRSGSGTTKIVLYSKVVA